MVIALNNLRCYYHGRDVEHRVLGSLFTLSHRDVFTCLFGKIISLQGEDMFSVQCSHIE